jgi:hypothetical protein
MRLLTVEFAGMRASGREHVEIVYLRRRLVEVALASISAVLVSAPTL